MVLGFLPQGGTRLLLVEYKLCEYVYVVRKISKPAQSGCRGSKMGVA